MNPFIRAYAYLNRLIKGLMSYFLRAESKGSLNVEGVVARIDRLPLRIRQEEYTLLVNIFLRECIDATLEGYRVNTPLFRSSLTIRGKIEPADLYRPLAPGRARVTFNLQPGTPAREAAAALSVKVCGKAVPKAGALKAGAPKVDALKAD